MTEIRLNYLTSRVRELSEAITRMNSAIIRTRDNLAALVAQVELAELNRTEAEQDLSDYLAQQGAESE